MVLKGFFACGAFNTLKKQQVFPEAVSFFKTDINLTNWKNPGRCIQFVVNIQKYYSHRWLKPVGD